MAEEVLVANDSNDTEVLSGRDGATFEGLLLAYGSLLIMALIPIYLGARRSVHFHDNLKVAELYYITIDVIRTYPERSRKIRVHVINAYHINDVGCCPCTVLVWHLRRGDPSL